MTLTQARYEMYVRPEGVEYALVLPDGAAKTLIELLDTAEERAKIARSLASGLRTVARFLVVPAWKRRLTAAADFLDETARVLA